MSRYGVTSSAGDLPGGFATEADMLAELRRVEREAIVAERSGLLGLARRYGEQVDRHVAAGRYPSEEGARLKVAIRAFADQAAQGLHRETADPDGVRAALRPLVEAANRPVAA